MNKYIEHIIKDLVRDTRIDYGRQEIYFPRRPSSPLLSLATPPGLSLSLFSSYCKEKYGLTKEEIGYVWFQYISIIKDKISKRES